MIRSYLRCIEKIEMISRRLTKVEKAEILEVYRAGENTNLIAESYHCTPNTIIRTVKTLLSETEYKLLKKTRAKIINKTEKMANTKIIKGHDGDLENRNSSIMFKEEDLVVKVRDESHSSEFDEIALQHPLDTDEFVEDSRSDDLTNKIHDMDENNNNFEVIAPLIDSFDFDLKKQKSDFEILNYESLPESVYMIVDKKVELELQPISDLPEWSFLPENELQRNAILLFPNQRSAKRICSRNQRVIKIPNTSIFNLLKSYLISKGITRLILEDSIIGLDC